MIIKSITNLRVGSRATGSPSDGEKCMLFFSPAEKDRHWKKSSQGRTGIEMLFIKTDLIRVNKWMEMQKKKKKKLGWKHNKLCEKRKKGEKQKRTLSSDCISCFASVFSSQLKRQAVWDHTYLFILFLFLTARRSCYAMNRFLYILITSTSWCERGRLQICSPSGLISSYPQIWAAVAPLRTLMKMHKGMSVQCRTPASIRAITATTIPKISSLLHFILTP